MDKNNNRPSKRMQALVAIQDKIDNNNLKRFKVRCVLEIIMDIDTAEHAEKVVNLAVGVALESHGGMTKDIQWTVTGAKEC